MGRPLLRTSQPVITVYPVNIIGKIRLLYSCHLCDLKDVSCLATERQPGEDIIEWINKIGHELVADHQRKSPLCRPLSLRDIKIPIEGADQIGSKPRS